MHQGSVSSSLLFIIVLEALSREVCVGCPWEMLNAYDLVILAESIEKVWKNGLESKGLNVNMGKIKILIASRDLHTLQTSGRYSCEVCRKGFRKNSIFGSRCLF